MIFLERYKRNLATVGDVHYIRTRTHIVFGEGDPHARLMFIGEGPGADEDREGRPFVGRAGQLLTKMIQAMGYSRSEVYIANVVKCRPPGNRDPEQKERDICVRFLDSTD
jgi:uracil-DNA glycosylase family 4